VSVEDPADIARLRKAFASLSGGEPSEPVDAERIFDALHGEASPGERQAIVDELLVNPAAAQAWRLARELPAEKMPKEAAPARSGWLSIAAAALLAMSLGWQFLPPDSVEEPAYRSVGTTAIASALPPGAALARARPVLRWTGVDGARYRIRVFTATLELLEESPESPAREYTISEETIRRVAPGSRILWQVEGRVAGAEVFVSPTFGILVP
jgi:hypothetical protein